MPRTQLKVLTRDSLLQLGIEEETIHPCENSDPISTAVNLMKKKLWKLIKIDYSTYDHYFERVAESNYELGKDKKLHLKTNFTSL